MNGGGVRLVAELALRTLVAHRHQRAEPQLDLLHCLHPCNIAGPGVKTPGFRPQH